jgi:phosphoribosylformylglycinamidine synthase
MIKDVLCQEVDYIWHKETAVTGYDALILPGGFSYGDYLRTGAIARFSPIMPAVIDFAHQGGLLLGICNGFQILLEAGLLPGAMLRNRSLKFICDKVYLKVKRNDTPFSNKLQPNEVINVPIAHGEGNYFCDAETLAELQRENRILFTYCNSNGQEENAFNPNGSVANIAGIINKQGNVLGMMPHPERCSEQILGGTDGYNIFASMLQSFQEVGC